MEVGEKRSDELQSVEEMADNILLCKVRTVHTMSIISYKEKAWGDEVIWLCEVCGCERYDSYDPHGRVLSRSYHPVPYSKVVGERLFSGDYRVEFLRRIKSGKVKMLEVVDEEPGQTPQKLHVVK